MNVGIVEFCEFRQDMQKNLEAFGIHGIISHLMLVVMHIWEERLGDANSLSRQA